MSLNSGDLLRDRYRIVELLGKGGFGRTYLAKDLSLNKRQCAIKEIPQLQSDDPEVLEKARLRFDREVRALSQLDRHPQIPNVFDCFEDNNNFYLVQEYIQGHPLSTELLPGVRWEEGQAIAFLQELLTILDFVHDKAVIHRDIKPSNLIRRVDGKMILIDFGAVRELGTLTVSESGEIATTIIGSPGYMPPEQQYGNPDFCSDIYAVGVIAIQALTGINPQKFLRDPETCEIIWIYATPDRSIVQVSDRLQKIINKTIRYDFRKRYQTVREILQDLSTISPEFPKPVRTRNPVTLNLGKLAVILGGCLIGISGAIAIHQFLAPQTCNSILDDNISCGEEILVKSLDPIPKQSGVEEFYRANYQESLDAFKKSWNQDQKDPETLIYMNNALLEAIGAEYYTIAIAVPLRRNGGDDKNISSENLVLEILRGVAQAQTEVNLSLLSNRKNYQDFPGINVLEKINLRGKGLRVIVADDRNLVGQSQKIATSLIDRSDILAVLGHYASDMTIQVVDIYERHHLVLMSFGSTTNKLTTKPLSFFLRTVGSTENYAPQLAKHLIQQKIVKAVLFYNPASEFTYSFKEDFKRTFLDVTTTPTPRHILGEFDLTKKEVIQQQLAQFKNQPDVAFVLSPDGEVTDSRANAIDIFKANHDRHWIASSEGLNRSKTLEIAAQLNSFARLVVSTHWHPFSRQNTNTKFSPLAEKLWGEQVNSTSALTYDAARAIVEAIRQQENPTRIGMQKTLKNPNFQAEGATGIIRFDPKTGDRIAPPQELIHIVRCSSQPYGVTFVPIEFKSAESAGLNCTRHHNNSPRSMANHP